MSFGVDQQTAFPIFSNPPSNDGAALGTTALQWSDVFLAEGAVINWDNGDITITQTGDTLAFAGGTSYTFDAAATISGSVANLLTVSTTVDTPAIKAVSTAASAASAGAAIGIYSDDGAAMVSGDRLGLFLFGGTSAASTIRNTAAVVAYASENWVNLSAYGTRFEFQTTTNAGTARTTKMTIFDSGGVNIGSPTGGDKGLGTLNAVGVYDDNTLLTDIVGEFERTGKINIAKWDSMVPDLIIPEHIERVPVMEDGEVVENRMKLDAEGNFIKTQTRMAGKVQKTKLRLVFDDKGNGLDAIFEPVFEEVVTPAKTVARKHTAAHLFKEMIDSGFDPRVPSKYIAKMQERGALPGMPNEAEWEHGKFSIGELHTCSVLAMEMLALVVKNLEDRLSKAGL